MSLDDARYALEVFIERLEVNLEENGVSHHQREQLEYQLKTAKSGLEQVSAHRKAMLSEVRERLNQRAKEMRGEGDITEADALNFASHIIKEME